MLVTMLDPFVTHCLAATVRCAPTKPVHTTHAYALQGMRSLDELPNMPMGAAAGLGDGPCLVHGSCLPAHLPNWAAVCAAAEAEVYQKAHGNTSQRT